MLTPMLPTVGSSWLDVLWVVDHSWYTWETVEREKPSSAAVLGTHGKLLSVKNPAVLQFLTPFKGS
jgi:hypothetical protein